MTRRFNPRNLVAPVNRRRAGTSVAMVLTLAIVVAVLRWPPSQRSAPHRPTDDRCRTAGVAAMTPYPRPAPVQRFLQGAVLDVTALSDLATQLPTVLQTMRDDYR